MNKKTLLGGVSAYIEHLWRESDRVRNTVAYIFVLHLLGFVLMWLYSGESGTTAYLPMLIFSFLINLVLGVYGCTQGAAKTTVYTIIAINWLGVVVQSVFAAEKLGDRTKDFYILGLGGLVMVLYLLVTKWVTFCGNKPKALFIWSGVLGLIGFAGCILLPEINGARCWLNVGGISLQITEIGKLLLILHIGLLYLAPWAGWKRFLFSAFMLGGSALLLATVVNEFGTLLVLGVVYVMMGLSYAKKWRWGLIAAVAVLIAGFMLGYSYVDRMAYRWECPSGCIVSVDDAQGKIWKEQLLSNGEKQTEEERIKIPCKECQNGNLKIVTLDEKEVFVCDACGKGVHKVLHQVARCDTCGLGKLQERPTYVCPKCYYRKFEKLPPLGKGEVYPCDNCTGDWLLDGDLGGEVSKLYGRFSVWKNYENAYYEDSSYQMREGEKSAILGGWFGNLDYRVAVPNLDNDSVMVGIMNYMGFVMVLVVAGLYFLLFLGLRNARSPVKTAAILALCTQMMLAFLGNFNLFALTGIGVPMISSGGTSYMVSLILMATVLTRDPRKPYEQKKGDKA